MKKVLLITVSIIFSGLIYAQCTDLFISEYVEGGDNNKAIELYNPTPEAIDLSGYRLVRYSNGQNVPPPEPQWLVGLSGIILPYRTFVIVLDKRDSNGIGQQTPVWDDLQDRADIFLCPDYDVSWAMYFNGDDALSLEKINGDFVDIFGKYGERPLNENGGTSNPTGGWSTVFPHSTGEGVIITRDHTMFRRYEIDQGVMVNPPYFNPMAEYDTLPENTFTNLNWHESVCINGSNQKPVFSQSMYEFAIPVNSPQGTFVGSVEAIDPNGDQVDYFITSGNLYHPFSINRTTGEIQVDKPDQIIYNQYLLTIDATDGTSPVQGYVYITIGNFNPDLFISEYVEGTGNNKALEIYNPTNQDIDLSAYQLVRYSNGGTTPHAVNLAGTIKAKRTFVAVLDKRDPGGTGQETPVVLDLQARADTFLCPVYEINRMMYFNGNDAVTLEKTGGTEILDIIARIGYPDPENGWTNITDTTITYYNGGVPTEYTITDYIVGPLSWLSWTKDNTLIRKHFITNGVEINPPVFNVALEWDSLPANYFNNLNWHECVSTNPNNNKPEFSQNYYEFEFPENSPAGTYIGNVFATDPDGDEIDFYIAGGNPENVFEINCSTGDILLMQPEEIVANLYTLTIDATDGTQPVQAIVTISILTDVFETNIYNLSIFPNPATKGSFSISANQNIVSADVFDLSGRSYKLVQNATNCSNFTIKTNGLSCGIYLIKITFKDNTSCFRKININ